MPFDAFAIVPCSIRGAGDIGYVIAYPTEACVTGIRVHFAGGTGTADLTIVGFDLQTQETRATLVTHAARGTGADVNMRFGEQELSGGAWTIKPGQGIKINWTNPDAANMTWFLEYALQVRSAQF